MPLFVRHGQKKLNCKSIPTNLVANVSSTKFKEFLTEMNDGDTSSVYSEEPNSVTGRSHSSRYTPSLHSQRSRRHSTSSIYSYQSLQLDSIPTFHNEEPTVQYGNEYELNVARENKVVIIENMNVFQSIILLKKDNQVRKLCMHLVTSETYSGAIMALILTSTLLALWSDQLNRQEHPWIINTVMEPFHAVILLVSWIDIFVHMIADGAFMLPKSYLRKVWNVLDTVNIGIQTVIKIMKATRSTNLSIYATGYLRILRVLRSIRIVYYVRGMRVLFLDLLHGLPKMIDAVALNLLVFVPFAIYGCYSFSGRFFLCNDDSITLKDTCFGEYVSSEDEHKGILLPKVWKNPYNYSFDTFGESLLHLFECASGEGWVRYTHYVMDYWSDSHILY